MDTIAATGPRGTRSPRVDLVFRLWQCDKENHGWCEGPPRPSLSSFDRPTGPSASGKVQSRTKKEYRLQPPRRYRTSHFGRYKSVTRIALAVLCHITELLIRYS